MGRWLFRCPECRTRRQSHALFTQHLRNSGHSACTCLGYHYKHRPGSPFCYKNPLAVLLDADRRGASEDDLKQIATRILEDDQGLADKVHEALVAMRISTEPLKEDHGSEVI